MSAIKRKCCNTLEASENQTKRVCSSASSAMPMPKEERYFEMCLSDGYASSDEDVDSVIGPKKTTKQNLLQSDPSDDDKNELTDTVKRLLDAGKVTDSGCAELVSKLMHQMHVEESAAISAASNAASIEEAIEKIDRNCTLCCESFRLDAMIQMPSCSHFFCNKCITRYFVVQITEHSINNLVCPTCCLPDLKFAMISEDEDATYAYFNALDSMLRNILSKKVFEVFQNKLRDQALSKYPNFQWCSSCPSGFIARSRQQRLICPDCGVITCALCKLKWEKQHEGISCEKYSDWVSLNDPTAQAKGVAEYLQANGIDCPNCKNRFSLSRGGCLHMTCSQCSYEFCAGCLKPMVLCTNKRECTIRAKHAHHPRNCSYYTRDKEVDELQKLLTMRGIPLQPPDFDPKCSPSKCPIQIQDETQDGLLVDQTCSIPVQTGYAGMCCKHYHEYLQKTIWQLNIDPLPILNLNDCFQEIRRRCVTFPDRGPYDTDEIYLVMCQKVIEERVPLNR